MDWQSVLLCRRCFLGLPLRFPRHLTTDCALHGALLSLCARKEKVSKEKVRPASGPDRCAPGVRSFHRCSTGTARRAILGPSHLSRRPCRSTPSTPIPLTLLTGTVRLLNHLCRVENAACGFSTARGKGGQRCAVDHPTKNYRFARTDSPVRRVSGIGAEGVERHGCRERRDGTRMSLRDVPLERRWSERTPSAQRAGPYAGRAFSLLTFSLRAQRESEAPWKAQSVALYRGKRGEPCKNPRQHAKVCRRPRT